MKKFWWSVFFGALFGILLLFPETNFSYRFFNLAHTLQLNVVQIIGLLALNTSILAGIFGALWGAIAQPYLSGPCLTGLVKRVNFPFNFSML